MVFVNAWNEWAKGAYLEPDRRYGYAYLAETKRVVSRFAGGSEHARLGVVVHVYYDDIWPEIRRCLHNIPEPFDLYVTIPPSLRDEDATPDASRLSTAGDPDVERSILIARQAIRRAAYAVNLGGYRALGVES
jgi:lipopolysaccharide biosynthesis protein